MKVKAELGKIPNKKIPNSNFLTSTEIGIWDFNILIFAFYLPFIFFRFLFRSIMW